MRPLLIAVVAVVSLIVAAAAYGQSVNITYDGATAPQSAMHQPTHHATPQPQQPQGIPVYGWRPAQVGTLYAAPPQPLLVPTVIQYYRWRPTLVGRALFGPYAVRRAPGPPMVYVPQ